MQYFPTNILYRQYRHYTAPLDEAPKNPPHTRAHAAQKLSITQYCEQDQCLPVKTKREHSARTHPDWSEERQTNIFKVIFK